MAYPEPSIRNESVQWSDFDPDEYWRINYSSVLPEDAEIMHHASKFLLQACGEPSRLRRTLDVGAGTNLYPALLMLPWARHTVFTEYAKPNVDWLIKDLADESGEWRWQPFWDEIADLPGYRTITSPRRMLAAENEVRTLSIFDLPRHSWELGSMFFVADGMTTDETEFKAAVRAFLDALRPGSPFLMAFMEGSSGYHVCGRWFPSVKITQKSLDALLAELPIMETSIFRTDNSIQRLRPGYDAMLLVTGLTTMGLR